MSAIVLKSGSYITVQATECQGLLGAVSNHRKRPSLSGKSFQDGKCAGEYQIRAALATGASGCRQGRCSAEVTAGAKDLRTPSRMDPMSAESGDGYGDERQGSSSYPWRKGVTTVSTTGWEKTLRSKDIHYRFAPGRPAELIQRFRPDQLRCRPS